MKFFNRSRFNKTTSTLPAKLNYDALQNVVGGVFFVGWEGTSGHDKRVFYFTKSEYCALIMAIRQHVEFYYSGSFRMIYGSTLTDALSLDNRASSSEIKQSLSELIPNIKLDW